MSEKFNRTIVFDFSKMSPEDIKKAREMFGGILRELPDELFERRPISVDDVIEELIDKLEVEDFEELQYFLERVENVNPGSFYSLVLKTIALMMDEHYPNHISECDKIYVFDLINGKVQQAYTQNISKKAWKYFAAFRTNNDAVEAIKLTQALRHELFQ